MPNRLNMKVYGFHMKEVTKLDEKKREREREKDGICRLVHCANNGRYSFVLGTA